MTADVVRERELRVLHLAVAGALARTGLEGCLANVAINVESIKDEHVAAGLTDRSAALRESLAGGEARHA